MIKTFQTAKPGRAWEELPEKVAMQLNDTHPSIGVAELMRILMDDHGLGTPTLRPPPSLHPPPSTLNPQPSTLHPDTFTLNLRPTPSTRHHINPQPPALATKPWIGAWPSSRTSTALETLHDEPKTESPNSQPQPSTPCQPSAST
jgi:hypothetical protein